jgi:ADP-heptose:LPS heptosyltransferase
LPDHDHKPYWDGPYLSPEPQRLSRWESRLKELDGFKVGICWGGSSDHAQDNFRSVRLAEFAPLALIPGVRLISLQKGPPREQLAPLSADMPVIDFGNELDESSGAFMDTAAIIRNLDLVISIDTATAHLAGGMGAPVWLALQLAPDWRWTLKRNETPWYPSMRLFRQRRVGGWDEVFADLADALRARLTSGG